MEEVSRSLVLPTRDDVSHISFLIEVAKSADSEIEVVVVDSGSAPGNQVLIQSQLRDLNLKGVTSHYIKSEQGLGVALEAGFRFSSGQVLIWFPTDGQLSPRVLEEVIGRSNSTDCVYVSRSSYSTATSQIRNLLSKVDKFIVRVLLKIPYLDFGGVYAVPTWVYKSLTFRYRTAAINWSIVHLSQMYGLKIDRVQARVSRRTENVSRIRRIEMARYPVELLRHFLHSKFLDTSKP